MNEHSTYLITKWFNTKFLRISRLGLFCKDGVLLQNSQENTWVFCKVWIWEIFKNTFCVEHLQLLAFSGLFTLQNWFKYEVFKFWKFIYNSLLVRRHSLITCIKYRNFLPSVSVSMQLYILMHILPLSSYMHTQNESFLKKKN